MKVTIASRIYLPEPAAASFRLGAVAKALVEQGSRVRILTTSLPRQGRVSQPESPGKGSNPRVSRWPVLRDKTGYVRGYLPYLSFDIPLFFRLTFGPGTDVILVEPPPTTGVMVRLAATVRRTPYVWYAADVWSDATEIAGAIPPVVWAVTMMEKFAVRGSAGVIAVSEGVAQRVRDLGGTNVAVIPNGIDTDTYHPDVSAPTEEELTALGIEGPYVIYAGTASEWQGASLFAAAMEILAEKGVSGQLVYVGQGSEWEVLEEMTARLRREHGRDVIVLVPSTTPEVVAPLLAGAQAALVSIVPGKGYDFAYPTKVLAGLAAGTPVIYAGTGPVTKDIRSGDLGETADYLPSSAASSIEKYLGRPRHSSQAERLFRWVVDNRSMAQMGRRAAGFTLSNAKR